MQRIELFGVCLVLGAAVTLTGCGGDGAGNWAGTVRDSAGVQIVENPATGMWGGGHPWQIRETLRIGTAEGEAEYQFGQIAGIVADRAGSVYVLDQQGQHVNVYDPQGQFVRTIGSAGSGPGQLSPQTTGIVLGRGDTLLVLDAGNARFNKYLPDGTSVGSFRVDMASGFPMRIETTNDGDLVVQLRRFAFPGQQSPDSMDHIVRMASASAPENIQVQPGREGPTSPTPQAVDTLLSFPQGATFSAAGGQPRWNFFSPEAVWDLRPDGGILFAVNSTYRVEVLDTTGAVIQIVTRPYEPVPVKEEDQDRMRESIINMMLRQMPQRPNADQLNRIRSAMHFADNYPAFAQVRAGPRHTIWVQHLQTPDQLTDEQRENFNIQMDLAAPRWDVFDAEGRFLGTIEMPGRIQIMELDGDALYGILRDEYDVQYVVRMTVDGMAD